MPHLMDDVHHDVHHTEDVLGIPPALDRALAHTVLADARAPHTGDPDAPSAALAETLKNVVDALRAQGARASEVMLAIEDAFAALVAGQRDPAGRVRMLALDGHARQVVTARLGYGAD
jgi:hypothetical protein